MSGGHPIKNEIRMWALASRYAVSDGVPRRSFYVALIVGTLLNLINQGDALLGAGSVIWLKVVLTYFVPYLVCTYGSVSSRLRTARSGASPHNENTSLS